MGRWVEKPFQCQGSNAHKKNSEYSEAGGIFQTISTNDFEILRFPFDGLELG